MTKIRNYQGMMISSRVIIACHYHQYQYHQKENLWACDKLSGDDYFIQGNNSLSQCVNWIYYFWELWQVIFIESKPISRTNRKIPICAPYHSLLGFLEGFSAIFKGKLSDWVIRENSQEM